MATTIEYYQKDERWQRFAEEYLKNGGKAGPACVAVGLSETAAYKAKSEQPAYSEWLAGVIAAYRLDATAAADIRNANAVKDGKPIDPKLLRVQEQHYKRDGKLAEKQSGLEGMGAVALPMDVIDDLVQYRAEKLAKKMIEAGKGNGS